MVYYSAKKLESLTSGLFGGITRAIRGSDEERAEGQLKENIEAIRAELPGLLVERIEIPGLPTETPDIEAVAALIPHETAATTILGAVSQAIPADAPPNSSIQAKVDARKNLTAMGMTYHSQQHFTDAIQRKDDVAVQLFIEGGGVSLDSADESGRTPLQIAEAHGTSEIVALLQPKPQAPAQAAVPVISEQNNPAPLDVDFSKVPANMLAEIDRVIVEMNLSPDQAQLERANLARQILELKAMADAVNESD